MTGWIIRIILFLIVVRLLLRFVHGLFQGLSSEPRGARAARAAEPLVRDPVCGAYLPRTRAVTVGSGATLRYFCSEQCREAYGKHA
jgi:uncharacterized protein